MSPANRIIIMKKLKIAITQGDTNGMGYKLIFEAFSNALILENCIPIIYGNPKIAAYHRKYYNSETSFHIIMPTDEPLENNLNLLTIHDEEIKVNIGESNESSLQAAKISENAAMEDFNKDLFDVLVSTQEGKNYASSTPKLYLLGNQRIMLVSEKKILSDVPSEITKENVMAKAQKLQEMLKSNFRLTNPRIAVLMVNSDGGDEEKNQIKPAIEELTNKGVQCFGPYRTNDFFTEKMEESFDAILAMYGDQLLPHYLTQRGDNVVLIDDGCHIIALPYQFGDEATLLPVIYVAIDAYRNKKNKEVAEANPLPKLFHEHREDIDRRPARFQPFDFEKPKSEMQE